jgi:hypothetical protein
VIEGREPAQDLDQVLGAELAGSTAGGYELGEAHLAHRISSVSLRVTRAG